jgi:hypothetical protein
MDAAAHGLALRFLQLLAKSLQLGAHGADASGAGQQLVLLTRAPKRDTSLVCDVVAARLARDRLRHRVLSLPQCVNAGSKLIERRFG